MIRVLIADDHAVVRKGLVQILSETMGIEVVAEAGSAQETMEELRMGDPPNVIVLDLNLPDRSGFDVLKQLRAEYTSLPVLVLSIHDEDQYAVRTLRAGAAGYLTKESAPDELVAALRRVAGGKRYVTPDAAENLLAHLDANPDAPLHAALSDREFQVMRLLAEGESVSGIAERLALSVKTISTYRSRLLHKMSMSSNAEVIRYAIKHDLA